VGFDIFVFKKHLVNINQFSDEQLEVLMFLGLSEDIDEALAVYHLAVKLLGDFSFPLAKRGQGLGYDFFGRRFEFGLVFLI